MTGLLAVEEAQARLFALAPPLPAIRKPLNQALGHYLSAPLTALRTQPAAPISAMDGYAIRFADLPGRWRLAGSIAAGQWPETLLRPGEAMRIFTGAPLPEGADTVLMQEDAAADGPVITLSGDGPAAMGQHVRRTGGDFHAGAQLAAQGQRVTAGIIALAAMAGHAVLNVGSPPRIAIITTGDELVDPGAPLAPGQIPESNGVMLTTLLADLPADLTSVRRIGDAFDATVAALHDASTAHDVIVTVGGASVGDHDHVHAALTSLLRPLGAAPDFWKIAMRPGKPLMAARLGGAVVLGLPGNPASAFVTAQLFLLPLIRHLAGATNPLPAIGDAPLATDLGPGGPRREYLRAVLANGALTPCFSQDSGFVTALAEANALIIREAHAPPKSQALLAPYIAL